MTTSIQTFCKQFRKRTLNKTLRDIELEQGINIKTLSAFENGRSSNINHLNTYVKACETEYQIGLLIEGINKSLLESAK